MNRLFLYDEVSITLRSQREVGNLSREPSANKMPYRHKDRAEPMQEADHKTTTYEMITTSNA